MTPSTVFSIVWCLAAVLFFVWGWWRYRNTPRWHGNLLLNVAPPGEPPLWYSTVTNQRFDDSELPEGVTRGGLFDWIA